MRLLTKTTLYFLLAMIPLLGLTGYLLFEQFNKQINQRADKELLYEEVQWVEYLQASTLNGSRFLLQTPEILIYPSDKSVIEYPELSTVYVNKPNSKIQIPTRQLNDVVNINGTAYEIIIRKSQEQKLALVENIIIIMLLVFAGLLLATIIFNWIISRRLWKPFQTSLQKIRNIELPQMSKIRFEETDTKEFDELNASLNTMVNKIHSDYVNMKEFTEDAAHEMQTPLAVAQTKMELLLQDANLTNAQTETIVQATTALQRLSKLNQSLLLLAKIENQQYEADTSIDLVQVTKKYLQLFDEITSDKQIKVVTQFDDAFEVKLHPFLADSLISNLLGNAIKYNSTNGKIEIEVSKLHYCISNTSEHPSIDPQKLFKRFTAAGSRDTSTGLGLAIVKRIADTHQLTVSYTFKKEMHKFCLNKNQ
ncbi:MAG TPA: HAMP domain-containing sensor histidine kinase [Flavisolibacter sp.]|jgi:signal transduction histidine kinase|nr:HAMP domain-containing sensor histidine kinase [Flavisolibacter sp.]